MKADKVIHKKGVIMKTWWQRKTVGVDTILMVFLGVLVFGVFVLWATVGRAEWYVVGDLMQARYQEPQVDGTWRQDRLPSTVDRQANGFTTQSLAWGGGVGYRAGNWSLEGGYRDWGFTSTQGLYIADSHYAQLPSHHAAQWLEKHGIDSKPYEVADHYQGGYLKVMGGLPVWGEFEPYATVGIFVAQHATRLAHLQNQIFEQGMVIGPLVGGGVKYALWQGVKARVGVESHWTLVETHNPVSSQWVTVGGGVEVPLTIGGF